MVGCQWFDLQRRYHRRDGRTITIVRLPPRVNSSPAVQTGYNERGKPAYETEILSIEQIPNIVVVDDEMADLTTVAGKEIEGCIQRLAQTARAAGIHLITATQRPSVDVITGTIQANFPTRISYTVTTKIDSRTILGEQGAEQLLGMGDLLHQTAGVKTKPPALPPPRTARKGYSPENIGIPAELCEKSQT